MINYLTILLFHRLLIMTKDFALVTFPNDGNSEEEIVSEVPSLWLRSNLTQCWWPSVKNINTFIIKQIPPVTDDPKWSLYPIRFHGYYGNKLIFYLRVYIVVFKKVLQIMLYVNYGFVSIKIH